MPLFEGALPTLLVLVVAIVLLGFVLRWTFGSRRSRIAEPVTRTGPADFGLLAPVATLDSAEQANHLRDRLNQAGIRATVGPDELGRPMVLVFTTQLDRARRVVGGSA